MNKTLEQWIAQYNKKVPEGFKRNERFELFYLPEKGFAEVMDTGKMILVYQVSGDFKFWRNFVEKIARRLGYTRAGTLCCRKIKPYLRMANAVPYRIDETPQGARYFCRDKHTGLEVEAAPLNDGLYCITWEVGHDD